MAVTFLTNEDEQRILDEANVGKLLITPQKLTEEEKVQARENIGAVGGNEVVKTDEYQELSRQQMDTARYNINAASLDQVVRNDVRQQLTEDQKERIRSSLDVPTFQDIDNVRAEIPSEKVYEHIATITVAPDADGKLPQYVIFTADSEGNPFELSDFIIRAHAGFVSGNKSTLYMEVNRWPVLSNSAVSSIDTSCRYFNIFVRTEADGCIRAENTSSAQAENWYNAQADIASSRLIPPMFEHIKPPFTQVKLYTFLPSDGTKAWVEGSTFELWGVRV